ncbi:MAG: hypothetical protein ACTSYD_10895 [Candidatus Heimdallarchaeaceae archaeon]
MTEEDIRTCPKCGSTMIRKHDYLPDDVDLKEVKDFWLCSVCMYYEIID